MKLAVRCFFIIAVALVLMPVMTAVAPNAFAEGDELVIADFNSGDKPNNINGDFGSWNKDPNDDTQSCDVTFESGDDALGVADGYSLRMVYDVDSPNPAYNGFWMKLEGENFSEYNTLNIYIKGDAEKGFTKRVKLELKDFSKSGAYVVSGITDAWQKFSIPFDKFKGLDLNSMNEFVVVFDDINSNPKAGSILIDHITVSKQ